MVFGPVLGLVTKTRGMSISFVTAVQSLTGSNPVEPGTWGLITSAPVAAIAIVSPSGGDFAKMVRPSRRRAGLVLGVDLASELGGQFAGKDPGDPIRRAAGCEWHDDLERLLR